MIFLLCGSSVLRGSVCEPSVTESVVCVQELELVEDVWRGEAQDLLSQIAQLQEENKSLLTNLSAKEPLNEEELQRHQGDPCCHSTAHRGDTGPLRHVCQGNDQGDIPQAAKYTLSHQLLSFSCLSSSLPLFHTLTHTHTLNHTHIKQVLSAPDEEPVLFPHRGHSHSGTLDKPGSV